jgi:hypothetical protein
MIYLRDRNTHRIHGHGEVSIKLENGQIEDIPNVLHVLGLKK